MSCIAIASRIDLMLFLEQVSNCKLRRICRLLAAAAFSSSLFTLSETNDSSRPSDSELALVGNPDV